MQGFFNFVSNQNPNDIGPHLIKMFSPASKQRILEICVRSFRKIGIKAVSLEFVFERRYKMGFGAV